MSTTTIPLDEILSQETVLQSTQKAKYLARQKDSFMHVGGGPEGWRPVPVKEITHEPELGQKGGGGDKIVFDLPVGYKTVSPITDRKLGDSSSCQLCGWAPLVNYWPIQNDTRKQLMWVGSECVNNFMGAGYLTKLVTVFKDNLLRKAFDKWLPDALAACESHRDKPYEDKWHIKHQGWLPQPYWSFEQKLDKMNSGEVTSRKIVNIFRKSFEIHLPIPAEAAKLLGLPEALQVTKVTESPVPVAQRKPMTWTAAEGWKEKTEQAPVSTPKIRQRLMMQGGTTFIPIGDQWVAAKKNEDGLWIADPNSKEPSQQIEAKKD